MSYWEKDSEHRCSALLPGNRCANGFKAGVACWPLNLDPKFLRTPMCCDEELCGEWFDSNGGKPWPRADDLAVISSQDQTK